MAVEAATIPTKIRTTIMVMTRIPMMVASKLLRKFFISIVLKGGNLLKMW